MATVIAFNCSLCYYSSIMELIFIGLGAVIIIACLIHFINSFKKNNLIVQTKPKSTNKSLVNCPLCGSPLQVGENLFSRVYRPMNVPDQRCTISGCPHCYPKCEQNIKRECPVCHKKVPSNGYLVARLFNKTEGKKHVIVTGCTECLKNIKKLDN